MTELKQLISIFAPEVMHYNDLAELNGTTTMVYISIIIFALFTLVMSCLVIFEYITCVDPAASKADAYTVAANRSIAFGSGFTVIFIFATGMMPDVFPFFIMTTLFYGLTLLVRSDH